MYKCALTTVSVSASTGDTQTKEYNGVNQQFIGAINGTSSPSSVTLPSTYPTFWEWADAVARALVSLSTDTFSDGRITAVFSINDQTAE